MMIGQLQPLKPQFVLQPFALVENKVGNLVLRTAGTSVTPSNLNSPIVAKFAKNAKVSARKRCSSGGMAGGVNIGSCSYQIDVNGKPAYLNEKYIGNAESKSTKSILDILGHSTQFGENCSSTNPTWKAKVKVWSSPLICPTGYEDVAPNGKCCKPIVAGVKVSDTVTKKPKTFLEKNGSLLILGGIVVGALLLTRK